MNPMVAIYMVPDIVLTADHYWTGLLLSMEWLESILFLMDHKTLLDFEQNFSSRLKSYLIHVKESVVRIEVNALMGRAFVMLDFLVKIVTSTLTNVVRTHA